MNRANERRIGVNWIPMRTDLLSDARVVTLALRTGVTQVTVVGALFVVWAQADAHGVGDHAHLSCPAEAIDVLTGVPGFAAALVEIGWMRPVENGVEFPNYLSHNGSTMKTRLLANRRQARWRKSNTLEFAVDAERYESNATPSQKRLPPYHTIEKRRKPPGAAPLPPLFEKPSGKKPKPKLTDPDKSWAEAERHLDGSPLKCQRFEAAWREWTLARVEKGVPLTPCAVKGQLAKLATFGLDGAIASIQQSIRNQWTGLFAPKEESDGGTNPARVRSPERDGVYGARSIRVD